MNVAVIGASGQLGTELVAAFASNHLVDVTPLDHSMIDVTDERAVRARFDSLQADAVVNCAAFHRVDECEDRPDLSFTVNAIGALHVARCCQRMNALCVYISSDYVFEGTKGEPYDEDDPPWPLNVYGASKLAGENLTAQACSSFLIVRVASLFGKRGASSKGGNFVDSILSKARGTDPLRVVNDTTVSPTYAKDAAKAIEQMVMVGALGTVHITNEGACTWYEFARAVVDYAGASVDIVPIESRQFPSRAKRPDNSSLKSVRRLMYGVEMPVWRSALKAYLAEHEHS